METKTVKAQVSAVAYRQGAKGQFPVYSFKYDGKELKGKAVWDKADQVTCDQALKDFSFVLVELETSQEEGKPYPNISVKSVKKFIDGETTPVQKPIDAPQSVNKPLEERKPIVTHPHPEHILSKDEQIERAVWVKEAGECIRSGIITKDNPIYMKYFATMALKF